MSTSPADGISKLSVEDASNHEAPPPHDHSAASPISDQATPANSGHEVPVSSTEVPAAPTLKGQAAAAGVIEPKPARTTCGVCEKEPSKYKCPHCSLAYCSVPCSRIHKETHPPSSLPPKPPPPVNRSAAAKTGRQHPFSILDDSPELRNLFKKYPNLPSTLNQIHSATLPPKKEPGTRGGFPWKLSDVDSRLLDGTGRPGGGRKKNEPWSQDVGLSRGRAALRKARMDPSDVGDGVREYCELVLYLLSKGSDKDEATAMVSREYTQEEIKLIETLQQQEHED
ncbi:hypothetical protein PspLS_05710 [Pyricularia sp. CBS 133598]|nr:hypothetical protein PspLS_05710 [Pyricularia sp. CBS 133598]